jgi:hypothetical protein
LRNTLGICAVFRDEARYLKEWVEFHLEQGVRKFFLFDDRSVDSPSSELRPYIEKGLVEIRPAVEENQVLTYSEGLRLARKNVKWLAFIDIDEFLFSPEGLITSSLPRDPSVAAVFVFWKLFGSSGHETTPRKGVLESFTRCLPPITGPDVFEVQRARFLEVKGEKLLTGNPYQGKSIVRTNRVSEMGVHFPRKWLGRVVDENGKTLLKPPRLQNGGSSVQAMPSMKKLRINHYWSKSIEDLQRKATRGFIVPKMASREDSRAPFTSYLLWDRELNNEKDLTILNRWRPFSAPFVFVIGFNKTATKSIAYFFSHNGMPAVHWDRNRLVNRMLENLDEGRKIFDGYDADYRVFTDLIYMGDDQRIEGNQFYAEMDRDYPNSFFILNTRDTEDWIASRMKHSDGKFLRQEMGFTEDPDPEKIADLWRLEKETHEAGARRYFSGHPRFLEIDIHEPDIPDKFSKLLDMEFDPRMWRKIPDGLRGWRDHNFLN